VRSGRDFAAGAQAWSLPMLEGERLEELFVPLSLSQ